MIKKEYLSYAELQILDEKLVYLFEALAIPFLTSGFPASKTFLAFLIYTTSQMGYQTWQASLPKNKALFSM